MAHITINDIPSEAHEKLNALAALKCVPPEVIALELLQEALSAHEAELARMLRLELQLFGPNSKGESDDSEA